MSALDDLERRIRTALTTAGIKTAVIGVDFSFNEDREGRFAPHWLIHLRVIVPKLLSKASVDRVRRQLPKSRRIPKPFRSAVFNGDLAGLAYSMKPNFERRQSYTQRKLTAERARVCRNTRARPLTGRHVVELAIYLDRIGLRRRLILHGARLVERNGTVLIARPKMSLWEAKPAT